MKKPECKSLCEIMLIEHSRLNNLLNEFEKDPSNQTLNEFKSNLEKHFFIEEKIIFDIL